MAAVSQPPAAGAGAAIEAGSTAGALAQSSTPRALEDHPAWPMISRLPSLLAVSIPLSGFKVCQLLSLQCGQTIGSAWTVTEDVPLKVGALQIGWGEFEVVEQRMALRLTRLA